MGFKGNVLLTSNSIKLSAPKGVDYDDFLTETEIEFQSEGMLARTLPSLNDNYGVKRAQVYCANLNADNIRGIYFNGIDYYMPKYDKVVFCAFDKWQDMKNSYPCYNVLISAYNSAKGNNITIEA